MKKICNALLLLCFLVGQLYASTNTMSMTNMVHPQDTIFPPPINLMEDEARLICPDETGFVEPLTLTDLGCESLQFGTLESISGNCATYISGFQQGTDILCLELCDAFMCDTFIYTINVMPNVPEAVDDAVMTEQEQSVLIRILDNDIFTGNPQVGVVIPSANATIAVVQEDGRDVISYQPNAGFCGADSLTYQICTSPALCSNTATVRIDVECPAPELTIYNGFSPNGDNINDLFIVEGLEDTVEDKIAIFNRWGNLVFSSTNYQNDWDGRWNGEDLPDGTYFYVIDDGDGNEHHGYIQLQR